MTETAASSSPSHAPCQATVAPCRNCQVLSTKAASLGYSIAHAFGAVFDNPGLITATVVVGDGEAETGPLATAWQSQ